MTKWQNPWQYPVMTGCQPVGSSLPPRREPQLVEARDAYALTKSTGMGDSIVVPRAQERMLEMIQREQIPSEVRSSLDGALTGNLQRQQLLFQAMVDTWPRLQKALREVKLKVRKAPWEVTPWSERGDDPTPESEKLAKEVEAAIWKMKPDMVRNHKGFEGTVEMLAEAYFYGHQVLEINWQREASGYTPASTRVVPTRFYGYPWHDDGQEDRLMLDRSGMQGAQAFEDFDEHKFLIAVNGGHPGHPSVAAPLRALAQYWLAAIYGLKWGMVFAQLFGVPFRWAEYADKTDKTEVEKMMANIGTAGWAAFKSGTKLNFLESSKGGNGSLPQWKLVELADEQCDVFILGQTLTSSQGDHGSQSLGTVHMDVRNEMIDGVCDFVGEILTHQLAPSIVALNYGREMENLPGIWAVFEKPKDEKGKAERMEIVKRIGLPVGRQWAYDDLSIPMPADGDELLFQPGPDGAQGDPATGEKGTQPHETKARQLEAMDGGTDTGSTVDRLSEAVLEGLTGVSKEWLGPVRPFFDRLSALAGSKLVTDEDFAEALEKAQKELPELFNVLDSQALQEAFEEAIGSAMLAGSTSRYE